MFKCITGTYVDRTEQEGSSSVGYSHDAAIDMKSTPILTTSGTAMLNTSCGGQVEGEDPCVKIISKNARSFLRLLTQGSVHIKILTGTCVDHTDYLRGSSSPT